MVTRQLWELELRFESDIFYHVQTHTANPSNRRLWVRVPLRPLGPDGEIGLRKCLKNISILYYVSSK